MSRIGLKPIPLPSGVALTPGEGAIAVAGPKGKLSVPLPGGITLALESNQAALSRRDNSKTQRALHGLTRALLANAVQGVTGGYERQLEIIGTGYRAEVAGQVIKLSLGFSHPVEFNLPLGIAAKVDDKKVVITLSGIDKQQIGQVAADLRALRSPDPYKGKGIRYKDEVVHLKPGKAAGK